MRNRAKGLKNRELKTIKTTIRLPKYINNFLCSTSNKSKAIKLAILNAFPELKLKGLKLGEKHLDADFDKTSEELKK